MINPRTSFQLKLKVVKDLRILKKKRVVNLTVHNQNLSQSQGGRNKIRKGNTIKNTDRFQVHRTPHLIQAVHLHLHQTGAPRHLRVIPVPPRILRVRRVEDTKISNTRTFTIRIRLIKSIPLQIT